MDSDHTLDQSITQAKKAWGNWERLGGLMNADTLDITEVNRTVEELVNLLEFLNIEQLIKLQYEILKLEHFPETLNKESIQALLTLYGRVAVTLTGLMARSVL